jgi:hypothetical protein
MCLVSRPSIMRGPTYPQHPSNRIRSGVIGQDSLGQELSWPLSTHM